MEWTRTLPTFAVCSFHVHFQHFADKYILLTEAGGDDEFQGNVEYTFTRPDGTQLGTQGKPYYSILVQLIRIFLPS